MKDERRDDDESHSRNQAKAQLESIKEMVAGLTCDYERLEELKEAFEDWKNDCIETAETEERERPTDLTVKDWAQLSDEGEELQALIDAAGEYENREDAEQRIQEDPLSVQVRSDWHDPGAKNEPGQFEILLCTGGPACRIIGELNQYAEPESARIEHQDWGTPWTEYRITGDEEKIVLTYCRCFYFGE